MARQRIVAVELELTEGTAHTLWAPNWREGNAEWQAILGAGDDAYLFKSAAELHAFIDSDARHDLTEHAAWRSFVAGLPTNAVADSDERYDFIGLPSVLADRPSKENVAEVSKIFAMARALGNIGGLKSTNRMFAANSVLAAVENGADHFTGPGYAQWSSIGRVIQSQWNDVLDELDSLWVDTPELDDDAVAASETALATAAAELKKKREEEEKAREAAAAAEKEASKNADPYDSTVWAQAGIDPIKISINGRTLYTLRCYLGSRPVFLGHAGTINTFSQPRTLVRWLLENDEHDLARLITWDDIMTAANAGELEATVHEVNHYSFAGLAEDIKAGPSKIDRKQLSRAYDLLADAADWAGDDSVNEVLASNQQLQWLLNYLLDTGEKSEPVPPYTEEAAGWERLESDLIARFTTKL